MRAKCRFAVPRHIVGVQHVAGRGRSDLLCGFPYPSCHCQGTSRHGVLVLVHMGRGIWARGRAHRPYRYGMHCCRKVTWN